MFALLYLKKKKHWQWINVRQQHKQISKIYSSCYSYSWGDGVVQLFIVWVNLKSQTNHDSGLSHLKSTNLPFIWQNHYLPFSKWRFYSLIKHTHIKKKKKSNLRWNNGENVFLFSWPSTVSPLFSFPLDKINCEKYGRWVDCILLKKASKVYTTICSHQDFTFNQACSLARTRLSLSLLQFSILHWKRTEHTA